MNVIKQIACVSVAALIWATPIVAEDAVNADTVVANVNGTGITLGHIISITSSLPPQYDHTPAADLYAGILDQLIQQTLIEQNAKDVSEKAIAVALENERRALISSRYLDAIGTAAITEEALQQYYEELITSGEPSVEFYASHILVETEEEAKEILKMARDGGDFAELAKEKSTGPSGPSGGDLGWFGRGAMVPEFDEAVAEMEVGGLSEPVKTDFGWHVIRLNDKRDYPTLESQRTELEDQLRAAAIATKIEGFIKDAEIESVEPNFNLELIRNTDLLE